MPNNIRFRVYGIIAFLLLSSITWCLLMITNEAEIEEPLGYKSADGNYKLVYQDKEWALNHDIILERVYKSEDGSFEVVDRDEGGYILNQDIVLEREKMSVNWAVKNVIGLLSQPVGLVGILVILAMFVFMKYMPPPYVLKQCFVKDKPIPIYPDLLPPDENITGVISWRGWCVRRKLGVLKSMKVEMEWESAQVVADAVPFRGSWHGIHAYRLGVEAITLMMDGGVSGLVSQSGIIIGHGDNVLRSEKCKILCLITKKQYLEPLLRERYNCPVYVVANKAKAINSFTISDSGIYWLSHNNRVIKDYLQEVY